MVWRGSAANPHVFSRTLVGTAGWLGEPARIDDGTDDTRYAPQVAANGASTLLSVWTQFTGGLGRIWKAVAP